MAQPRYSREMARRSIAGSPGAVPGSHRAAIILLGWKSERFTDPHVFLDYVRTRQPRLAVIDISMPVMHGLEVQTRLRTASPSTRVIILTARGDHSVRRKAMAGGVPVFLLKAGGEDELSIASNRYFQIPEAVRACDFPNM